MQFSRILEMLFINCEINLILTWSINCVISEENRVTTIEITNKKINVPVVTFPIQDSPKLLQQLKSRFKRTINWNKYQLKWTAQNAPNQYLDYLTDSSVQGVNRFSLLAFNADNSIIEQSRYYLPTEKVKDYNARLMEKALIAIRNDNNRFT